MNSSMACTTSLACEVSCIECSPPSITWRRALGILRCRYSPEEGVLLPIGGAGQHQRGRRHLGQAIHHHRVVLQVQFRGLRGYTEAMCVAA